MIRAPSMSVDVVPASSAVRASAGMGGITHSGTGARCQDGQVGDELAELLSRGTSALAGGDWAAARACFEEAVQRGSTAEALDGLAQALFSDGEYAAAIDRGE